MNLQTVNTETFDDVARLTLAQTRDGRVRELERQYIATWSELAELCRLIEEQQDWRALGFESYGKWLINACPHSRSAVYAARGLLEELKELQTADLREIPLGSAKTLAKIPASKRTDVIIAKAKSSKPAEFVTHVQEKHPELHIETEVPRKYKFDASQAKVIDAAITMANILEAEAMVEGPMMADEVALEKICADFMRRHQAEYEAIKG